MSTTIDHRVVEMRFDNKEFEKNVSTTMSSLDKLKEKLRFKNASKGFDDLNRGAKNVNLSPIEKGAEAVRVKFSAMQILGVTAMQDLANTAVQTGKRIASALTIDPIRTGFSEYETQIGAIQTILANTSSKGTTIDDVNQALDTLNTYADKTIYNFTEMTRNIGTFTAAGVDLDTSVKAIQGIANLAAVSGSTSQQASTAMYQLSQALATGTVRLMDWNSVVNAGMGGEVFQNALKETARVHGVAIDEIIEKNGSFRDSLQDEWLTTDILNETLEKFTMNTKWATEAEIEANRAKLKSIGYTDEQIEKVFELGDTATGAATEVKTFTQLWDTLKESAQSGWTQTWELIVGDFYESKDLLTRISKTIGNFINMTSDWRNNLLGGALSPFSKFITQVNEAGVTTDKFEKTFKEVAKSNGYEIDKLIEKHGSLKTAIMHGEFNSKTFVDTLKKLAGATSETGEATEATKEKLEEYQKLFDEVWRGDWGNGIDRVNKMIEAGHDYAAIQDLVNKHEAGHKLTLEDLNGVIQESTDLTDEQKDALSKLAEQAEKTGTPLSELITDMEKKSGRVLLIESFENAFSGLFTVLKQIKAAWQDTFDPITSSHLYTAIVAINTFSQILTVSGEQAEKFKRIFKGVFALLDAFLTIIGGPLKWAFDALITIIKNTNLPILDLLANLGDALVNFRDWVDENNIFLKALEKLTPHLQTAAEAIKGWIDGLREAENIPAYIASSLGKGLGHIVKFVSNIFKSIVEYVKGGMKEIPGNIVSGLVNGLGAGVSKVISKIIEFGKALIEGFKSVLGIHSPSKVFFALGGFIVAGLVRGLIHAFPEAWQTIKDFASGLFGNFGDRIQNGFDGILGDFKWFGEKIKNIFSKLDFGTVFVGGLYVTVLYTATKIANAIATLAAPFDGLGDMFRDIGNGMKKLFKSMSGFFNAAKWRMMSGAMINLAIAVAILAAAVAALVYIGKDNYGALWNAVAVITVLAAVMTGLMIAVSRFTVLDVKGLAALTSVALIAGALLAMVYVLKQIETLNEDKLGKTLLVFTGIVTGLIALVAVFGLLNKASASVQTGMARTISTLLGIAAVMLVMLIVMKQAGKLDEAAIVKGTVVMVIMGAMIVAFGYFMKKARKVGANIDKAGAMLVKMAIALGLMLLVIKIASKLDTSTVTRGLTVIAAIGLLFTAFVAVSKLAGKHADKAGKMLLKMSVAMSLMAISIAIIGNISSEKIAKAMGAIAAISLLFVAFVAVSKFAGEHGAEAGKMILKMSIAMLILAGAIFVLSMLDPAGVVNATMTILALGAMFALILHVNKTARKTTGPIIAMTVAIGLLIGALIALTFITPASKFIGPVLALGIIMGALALVLNTVSKLTQKIKMGPIIMLTVVIGLLAALVGTMAAIMDDGQATKALKCAAAIGVLMLTMAASLALVGLAGKVSAGAILGLGVMLIAAALIAGLFWILQALKIDVAMKTVLGISVLILALSASLALLGAASAPILAGSLALAALILILGTLMIAIGDLFDHFDSLEGKMERGCEIIRKIFVGLGTAIGEGIGALITGIGNQVMGSLPGWGQNIADFITPISAATENIPDGIGSKLAGLAAGLIALTGASLLNGLTELMTLGQGGIDSLGEDLGALATGIRIFSDKLTEGEGVNFEAIDTASKCVDGIVEIANKIKGVGGLKQIWSGDNGLGRLGKELAELGPYLNTYSKAISADGGLNVDGIKRSAEAVAVFGDVAAIIPRMGGLSSVEEGSNTLGKLGKEIVKLAGSLVDYSNEITKGKLDGDKIAQIKSSGEAIKAFGEVAAMIPAIGGLKSKWSGDNSLGTFGEQLASFGASIVTYSKVVSAEGAIDLDAINNSAKAAKALVGMYDGTPKFGGFISLFTADHDLTEFSTQLTNFANGMRLFMSESSGVTVEAITPAVEAAAKLTEMYDGTPKLGGFIAAFTGEQNLSKFGTQLSNFGTGIYNFACLTKGIDATTVEGGVAAAKSLASMYDVMPKMEGLFASFGEHTDMQEFSAQLVYLANGIAMFVNRIGPDINAESIKGPVDAAMMLSEVGGYIATNIAGDESSIKKFSKHLDNLGDGLMKYGEKVNGLPVINMLKTIPVAEDLAELGATIVSTMINDENSIKSFGNQLDNLGKGLKNYADKMKNFKIDNVNETYDAVGKIIQTTNLIPASAGDGNLSSFASQLDTLAASLSNASSSISTDTVTNLATNLPKLADSLVDFSNTTPNINVAGLDSVNTFLNEIKNFGRQAIAAGNNLAQKVIDGITVKLPLFKAVGIGAILQFKQGVETLAKTLSTRFKNIVGACVTGASDKWQDFYDAGAYVGAGFQSGLASKRGDIVGVANSIADAVKSALRSAFDMNSPSKVTYEMGEYVGEGFVLGMGSYADKTYDSAYNVADSAKTGLNAAIAKMKDIFGLDLDSIEPKIKPVLDLSDVRAGAGLIPGLLDFGPSVGVLAHVNGTAATMRAMNQNGNNNDLLEAINGLRKDLSERKDTSYTINGVSYSDDAGLKEAFETIIRATRIGRRT